MRAAYCRSPQRLEQQWQGLEEIAEEEGHADDAEESLAKSRVAPEKTNALDSDPTLSSVMEDCGEPVAPSPRVTAAADAETTALAVTCGQDAVFEPGGGEKVVVSFSIPGPVEEEVGGAAGGDTRAVRVAVLDVEEIQDAAVGGSRGVELQVNRGAGMEDEMIPLGAASRGRQGGTAAHAVEDSVEGGESGGSVARQLFAADTAAQEKPGAGGDAARDSSTQPQSAEGASGGDPPSGGGGGEAGKKRRKKRVNLRKRRTSPTPAERAGGDGAREGVSVGAGRALTQEEERLAYIELQRILEIEERRRVGLCVCVCACVCVRAHALSPAACAQLAYSVPSCRTRRQRPLGVHPRHQGATSDSNAHNAQRLDPG